ncbi:hypothetical protein C8R43DRAFT_963387 [Mycena crocata]|nr:hypothetical protein C8R43DRAFT_963387 [Mycena crocata]
MRVAGAPLFLACFGAAAALNFSPRGGTPLRAPRVDDPAASRALPRTNAARLAQGLPLIKPRRRDSRYPLSEQSPPIDPSIVIHPDPARSTGCNLEFRMDDRDNPYNLTHYVTTYTAVGIYAVYPDYASRLKVTLEIPADSPDHISLKAVNGPFAETSHPYFGAIAYDDDLLSTSTRYAWFGGTENSAPSETAHVGDTSVTYGGGWQLEAAIFSYDPVTRRLTPKWVNDNGEIAPASLYFGPSCPLLHPGVTVQPVAGNTRSLIH